MLTGGGGHTTTSGFPGPGEHIPARSPSVHPRYHPHLGGHSLDSWSHGLRIHSTDEAQTCKGDTRSTPLSFADLEAQGLPVNGQWKTGTSGMVQWLGDQF